MYAELLSILGLTDDACFARQNDARAWPTMKEKVTAVFATRPRDEWAELFEGPDACVAPMPSLLEAPEHPRNAARGSFRPGAHGGVEPAPSPRFSASPAAEPFPAPVIGADTDRILATAGIDAVRLAELRELAAIG